MAVDTELAIPASIANLGGGFDTLALAVRLYLRIRIVDVRHDGRGAIEVARCEPPVHGENLIGRAYAAVARRRGAAAPSVVVEAVSEIPIGSGLGSSAAAVAAGLRVFEAVAGPVDDSTLLAVAAEIEGHGDNVAAALFGGFVSVVIGEDGAPMALRWTWPDAVRVVVATPAAALPTKTARAVLSGSIPRADGVYNLQRVLLFVHALQAGAGDRLREGMRDRWHQPARAALVPCLSEVLALEDPAILGACLSGAGPSVAVLTGDPERAGRLLAQVYEKAACPVTIRTLAVHEHAKRREGVVASAARGTV